MEDIRLLMTPEFIEFSTKVAELVKKKDARVVEFKAIEAKYKELFTTIDQEVTLLLQDWEEWKKTQTKVAEQ